MLGTRCWMLAVTGKKTDSEGKCDQEKLGQAAGYGRRYTKGGMVQRVGRKA
jgi:hypothetical protein